MPGPGPGSRRDGAAQQAQRFLRRLLRQDPQPLTAREIEVLRQAAQMLSTEEIAAALHLSVNTVARCG